MAMQLENSYVYGHSVNIFAKYISSCISPRALDARKFDVSEQFNHYSTNRIDYVRENDHTKKPSRTRCAKSSSAKISTFTVLNIREISCRQKYLGSQ